MVRLCKWIRNNTFCTYFDAFRAILPPGLSYTLQTRYEPVNGFTGSLTSGEQSLLTRISELREKYSPQPEDKLLLKALKDSGAIKESELLKRRVGDETTLMVKLAELPEGSEPPKLTPKQKQVLEFLEENSAASVHEVCYALNITAAVVKRLVEKGLLEEYEYQVFRLENTEGKSESPSDIVFSPKQQGVFNGLLKLMNDDEPKCALLRGVTGSGKTSVFIRLIDEAVKQGKTAIMLVPEISLTPQMVGKFRRLFGDDVAILHSSLSLGERADEYTRIKTGRAHIVVGTRSAVFAPVKNLGIIVIDEEGEGTYKSESAPRYHARDVAKQRCFYHNAFLLLASATPSLESYYNAKIGRYSLFELDERYNNALLPDVYIVDMRVEQQNGNHSAFSMPLIDEMRKNLENGEQSILLLNRPGISHERPLRDLRQGDRVSELCAPADLSQGERHGGMPLLRVQPHADGGLPVLRREVPDDEGNRYTAHRGRDIRDIPEGADTPHGRGHDRGKERIREQIQGVRGGGVRHNRRNADDSQGAGFPERNASRSAENG